MQHDLIISLCGIGIGVSITMMVYSAVMHSKINEILYEISKENRTHKPLK